jgi:hypothetical protein
MRNLSIILLSFSLLVVAGCACDGPRTPRDVGGGSLDGGGPGLDAPGSRPDAPNPMFPDVLPTDVPCMVTTPVMNEIIGDPPDILIVMDVSGSMCTPLFPSPQTKMEVMRNALTGLVTAWDGRVNWGLMQFPGDASCGAGNVVNPIMPRNGANISSRLAMLAIDTFGCVFQNQGATPTAPSIDAARTYFAGIPVNPIGRYVILATDGLPNCGPVDAEGNTEETVDETVAAIAALQASGVNTYVLGFGADISSDPATLMRMATAGGTSRAYSAGTPAELEMALDTIAAAVTPASCTLALDGGIRSPDLFQVSFAGGPLIPRDVSHTRGWDYDDASNTITFYGPECDQVQSGAVADINVDFGCPGPVF